MEAIRIEFYYGFGEGDSQDEPMYDTQLEMFVSGPGAAIGHIHDVLAGNDRAVPEDELGVTRLCRKIVIDPLAVVPDEMLPKTEEKRT